MHRTTVIFWLVMGILVSASLFYGLNAARERKTLLRGAGKLENGDIVRLERIVDGDTVTVFREGEPPATVRILGIKAFEAKVERDAAAPYGRRAVAGLERLMADRPLRVMLNAPPKDSRGRFLATLYVGDRDVGLELVKEGLVLVYSVYPFPAMSLYLHEQDLARSGKKGIWGDPEVRRRAVALISGWQEEAR